MAMVGGMTGVNKDVPPFSLFEGVPGEVKGLNTVGLRRNGIDAETRATIKKALRLLYLSKRNRALALAEVERELPLCPELERLLAFVKATQHGRNGRQLEH
jgi:UDP-N-acetylglucosamine acyltransferase